MNWKTKLDAAAVAAVLLLAALGCSESAKTAEWTKAKVLADKLDHPSAITADEKNIYFVTGGTIASLNEGTSGVWKMPISGGPPSLLFKGYKKDENTVILPASFVLATDDKYLYFSAGHIYRVPKDGGDAVQVTAGTPTEMTVDNERIYWHNFVGEGMAATPAYSIAKAGGEVKTMTGAVNISAIAVDDTSLYWAQPDGIYKTPKSGGDPVKVYAAPDKQSISGLAADRESLYFTIGSGKNALMKIAKTGGDPVKLIDEINHTHRFFVDDATIYFVKNEGSFGTSVNFMPKNGGPSQKADAGYIASYFAVKEKIYVADISKIYELDAKP